MGRNGQVVGQMLRFGPFPSENISKRVPKRWKINLHPASPTIYFSKPRMICTVKKPRVINAFLSFRNAFLNQKREREHFETFQTVL